MYVYRRSGKKLWTVGFFGPRGKWYADTDHATQANAAARVHFLNGGSGRP